MAAPQSAQFTATPLGGSGPGGTLSVSLPLTPNAQADALTAILILNPIELVSCQWWLDRRRLVRVSATFRILVSSIGVVLRSDTLYLRQAFVQLVVRAQLYAVRTAVWTPFTRLADDDSAQLAQLEVVPP